jgi:hypothetical protein
MMRKLIAETGRSLKQRGESGFGRCKIFDLCTLNFAGILLNRNLRNLHMARYAALAVFRVGIADEYLLMGTEKHGCRLNLTK